MPDRQSPQRTRNDLEFPIRIRVRMPQDPSKKLIADISSWLFRQCGREGFTRHQMHADLGVLEVFYFHRLEDAQAFMAAFPELELAPATIGQRHGNKVDRPLRAVR